MQLAAIVKKYFILEQCSLSYTVEWSDRVRAITTLDTASEHTLVCAHD